MSPGRAEALFLAAVLGALALLQSTGITRPFLRQHESVGTELGKHARNHLRFGLAVTRGLKLDVSGPSLAPYPDPRDYFYVNHPPLPALVVAGAFAVAGVSEAAYRGLLLCASLAAVLLFRRLALRLLPPPWDRLATVLFAFTPLFAYYSVVTGLQVLCLLGLLSGLLCYLRWVERPSTACYLGLWASLAWACGCAWAGYYLAPALVLAHLAARRPRRGPILALLAANLLCFGAYLLWLQAADPGGGSVRKLLSAAADRSSSAPLAAWAVSEAREWLLLLTLPALALGGIAAARGWRRPWTPEGALIASLLLLGLDEVLFRRLVTAHEYFSYFLCVPVALGAAAGARELHARIGTRRPGLATGVLSAFLLAFLAQSSWILHRRFTREGAYSFYRALGLAMAEATRPEDRILVLTDHIPFYTPFYGDRHVLWHDARGAELVPENSGGRRPMTREALLADLAAARVPADWVVTTDAETVSPVVPFTASLTEEQRSAFGIGPAPAVLRERFAPPLARGGFLFWRLGPR